GNVGIGATNPAYRLVVQDNVSTAEMAIKQGGDTSATRSSQLTFAHSGGGSARISATRASGSSQGMNMKFYTEPSSGGGMVERIRIESDGKVGIGTTSPSVSLDLGTMTDAVSLPTGTTAQQPSSPADGMIRYNTTNSKFEAYENGAWVNMINATGSYSTVTSGSGTALAPSITFTGDTSTGFYNPLASTIGMTAGGTNIFNFSTAGMVSPTSGGSLVTTAAGSAAAPNYSFTGDSDTGWYSPAANTMAAATGGSERVRIDSSGSVGIGTASPRSQVEIVSNDTTGLRLTSSAWGNPAGHTITIGADALGREVLSGGIQLGSSGSGPNTIYNSNTNGSYLTLGYQHTYQTWMTGNSSQTGFNFQNASDWNPSLAGYTGNIMSASGNIASTAAETYRGIYVTPGDNSSSIANTIYGIYTDVSGGTNTSATRYAAVFKGGNVGVGTTAPATQFSVSNNQNSATAASVYNTSGGVNAEARIQLNNGAANSYFNLLGTGVPTSAYYRANGTTITNDQAGINLAAFGASGDIQFWTGGSNQRMAITSTGNVGIGATAPGKTLDVQTAGASARLYNTLAASQAELVIRNTTANFSLVSDLGGVGANSFDIYDNVNSTSRMTINNGGNVGIGTTSPGADLDIERNVDGKTQLKLSNASATANAYAEIVANNGTVSTYLGSSNQNYGSFGSNRGYVYNNGTNAGLDVATGPSGDIRFITNGYANGNEKMRILANGNVGIGTTNPLESLHVNGTMYLTSAPSSALRITADASANWIESGTSGTGDTKKDIRFSSMMGVTPWLSIQGNTGNVGIGTTDPTMGTSHDSNNRILTITGSGSASNYSTGTIVLGNNRATASVGDATGAVDFVSQNNAGNGITSRIIGWLDGSGGASGYGGALAFSTKIDNNSAIQERMRITSAGNVGIGNTSPSYKLDVTGDISASGCLRSSAGVASGVCVSDERLKNNVQPFDLGLNALLGIRPHYFKYNGLGGHPASDKLELGVIAQEVEKTAPELIITKDVQLNPNDSQTTEIKQVNYTAFTYVLINSVKELYHRWFDDSQAIHRELASKDQKIQKLEQDNAEKTKELEEVKSRLDKIEKMLKSK
ncbi:MAG: tail fiber domain-containing protein, partial [Bdellovibrionaceae bacterium]|nr:tail fiber domain-containing protein [Pseudobdellovibrionaceae bacterium]